MRFGTLEVDHLITDRSGGAAFPRVAGWEASEEIMGGYAGAMGTISMQDYKRWRSVIDEGAAWRIYHRQTGENIYTGRLEEPVFRDGQVELSARGYSQRFLDRETEEAVLYAEYGYDGWQEFGESRNPGMQWDMSNRSLRFEMARLTDGHEAATDLYVWRHWPPGVELTRLTATLKGQGDSGTPVLEATLMHITITVGTTQFVDNRMDSNSGGWVVYTNSFDANTFEEELDLDLTVDVDSNPIDPLANYIMIDTSWSFDGDVGTDVRMDGTMLIQNLRVFGASLDEDDGMSSSQLATDLIERMGLNPAYVEKGAGDLLPYSIDAGMTYREHMEYACLIAGKVFTITGERPLARFFDWNDDLYTVNDERFPSDLIPVERFDTIMVPYRAAGPFEEYGIEKVRLDPSPLEVANNFGRIDLQYPVKVTRDDQTGLPGARDSGPAEQLGLALLDWLKRNRRIGSVDVAEVMDEDGMRMSAQRLHAGICVRLVGRTTGSGRLWVTKVTHTATKVTLECEDHVQRMIEAYTARRDRRIERRRMH